MAFGSAARSVKLYFTGDSTNLERALSRTETKMKRFERVAGKQSSVLNSGLFGGLGKGGAITAGAGLAVLGIKSVTDAAKNAEVILGQTSVAVEDAGLSWEKYGEQVQAAALNLSKSSAFDDEAVMQSFQVFVRGQKNVAKSLELSSLAADVARGRYTDLESATQLVNKAAMGQIGALRRAGIQIDKNATATEALTALQSAYGGAAVRYANNAAGAQDKLSVSVENLKESLGSKLLPALTKVVGQMTAAAEAGGHLGDGLKKVDQESDGFLGGALKNIAKVSFYVNPTGVMVTGIKTINNLFGDTKDLTADIATNAAAFSSRFGLGKLTDGGESRRKGFGDPDTNVANGPTTGVSTELHNRELDARLSGNRSTLKGVLAAEAAFLQNEIKNTLPDDQGPLKEALLGVTSEIKAIDQDIIDDANDKKQAIADAKAAQKAAHQKALDALKAQAQAFKDQASAIKSAVLDAFDTKQSKTNNARALADAKDSLRLAKMIGDPTGVMLAGRGLADAKNAITRQQIEAKNFTVTAGPKGPVNTVTVGNVTINIRTTDPEAAGKAVADALGKAGKRNTGQARGRAPGFRPF